MLSSGRYESKNPDGEIVTDDDKLVQLLLNPNKNQNGKQFLKEWLYFHLAHGYNYVNTECSSVGFEKKFATSNVSCELFNLDGDHIDFNSTNEFFDYFRKNKKTNTFNYKPLGLQTISVDDVIKFFDIRQDSKNPNKGVSRLISLKPHIDNYNLCLQTKANFLKGTGARIICLDGKTEDYGLDANVGTGQMDSSGNPITTTYKKILESQLQNLGLSNDSYGIAFMNLPIKVIHLSEGLEKIPFDSMTVESARTICNKFNIPKEFTNLTNEAAKFANRQSAMVEVIQNTIEPFGKDFTETICQYFNWPNTITLKYDHLPVFTENEGTKVETMNAYYDLYKKMFQDGSIDEKTFNEKIKSHGITD